MYRLIDELITLKVPSNSCVFIIYSQGYGIWRNSFILAFILLIVLVFLFLVLTIVSVVVYGVVSHVFCRQLRNVPHVHVSFDKIVIFQLPLDVISSQFLLEMVAA